MYRALAVAILSTVLAAGLLTCLTAQAGNSPGTENSAVPELQTIVGRMEQAEQLSRSQVEAYNVTRQYQIASGSEKPSSEVLARVSFTPPGQEEYVIERSSGSSRGEKVVRSILEHEAKWAAQAARDGRVRNAVNQENYNFAYLGTAVVDGQPCFVLKIIPKHQAEYLVDGRAFVDARRYQIRQIDGVISKSPSWWLKSVHVTMGFREVGPMWLQDASRAVADVRIFGEHTLTSRALNFEIEQNMAQNRAPGKIAKRGRRPSVILGAGVLQPR